MINFKEFYEKVLELERMYGEDFYDLGGGSIAMSDAIENLSALEYLKENKPCIYNHICEGYKESFGDDLDTLVSCKAPYINKCEHDYFFVFNNKIKNERIFEELKEFSDDSNFKCEWYELWKVVIVLLAGNFPKVEKVFLEIFEKNFYEE